MAVPLTTKMQGEIANLYISILGRNPDPVGFGYWCDVYANANGTKAALDAIASGFGKSPEFVGIYSGQTVAQAVALMYNNIIGRPQDQAGADYWITQTTNAINSGRTVGDAYAITAQAMITAAQGSGTADATNTLAKQAAAIAAGTATPASTYTLTTNIDTATATFFDGSLTSAGVQTLNSGDRLTGKGVSGNTLDATITASVTPALLSNIQTVEITSNGAGANTVGLINATGTTTLVNDGSAQGLTFANAGASATTVTVQNTAQATTVAYTTTTGTQTIGLNLSNVTGAATVTMAGIEIVNVASNGAANSVDLELDAATTLNFSGAQNLTVAALATGANTINVSNINASAMTGNFTVDVGNQTGVLSSTNISITGGSGNDSITFTGVTQAVSVAGGSGNDTFIDTGLTTADTIDGGIGGVDTLSSTSATLTGYTAPTTRTISNIEAITVSDALGGNLTLSNIQAGLQTVNLASTASLTGNRTITFDSGVAGRVNLNAAMIAGAGTAGLTVASAGTGLTDTITIANNSNGINVFSNAGGPTAQAITATGVETLVINTYGSGALVTQLIDTISVTGSTGATTAETVNFVGANAVTTAAIQADIVNASGLTATTGTVFTASLANAANATVTGSAGNDSITSATGNDVLNGGAGNDTLTAATGNDSLSGGDGTDRLVFATAGDLTVNDTVDGGTGTNTLVATADDITTNNALVDTVDLTALGRITNVQTLEVTGVGVGAGSSAINAARVSAGITTVNTVGATGGTASTFTFNSGASTLNLGQGLTTTAALGAATTLVAAGTGTADAVTVVKATTENESTFASRALTLTGIETINFNVGAVTASTQGIGTVAFTPTTTNGAMVINLSGADDATLAAVTTTGTGLLTINASGLTIATGTTFDLTAPVTTGGTVSITGSAGNDVLRGDINDRNTIDGGAGNDSLVGGSAADSLVGGTGIDTINSGGGNDTMLGGDGNDTITFTAATADIVSIDGGAGNDTVTITTFSDVKGTDIIRGGEGTLDTLSVAVVNNTATAGAGVTEFELLSITTNGAASQAMTTVFTNDTTINRIDFSGTTGVKAITAASAGLATVRAGDNTSLTVTRTTDTTTNALTVAGVADANVTIGTLAVNDEESLTLNAGLMAANKTLTVSALNAIDLTTLTITGVQATSVTVGASAATTGLGTTARGVTVNASAATGTVVVDAGTALATQAMTMTGSSSASNTLTGGLGNDTITGGNAADTLVGGLGADVINGVAGTDTFSAVGMNATSPDGGVADSVGAVVNLGATTLTAAAIATATGGLRTSASTTPVASNTAVYLASAASGGTGLATTVDTLANITNVIGSGGTDYIVGSAAANTITGGAGVDTINGGGGADTVTDAGVGGVADTIIHNTASSTVAVDVTGTGTVTLTATQVGASATVAGTVVGTVNASTSTFAVSMVSTSTGNQVFTGGSGADTITSAGGDDTLVGGAGNDTMTGGAGADRYTGGDGADTITDTAGINQSLYLSTTVAGMVAEGGDIYTTYTGLNATNTTGINFATGLLVNGAANKTDVITAAGATLGAADVILVASDAVVGASDMSTAAGALAGFNLAYTTQANLATGDRVLFIASGTAAAATANSYGWLISKGAGALVAADLTLVATFGGVADATAAVFGADNLTIPALAAFTANTDIFSIG